MSQKTLSKYHERVIGVAPATDWFLLFVFEPSEKDEGELKHFWLEPVACWAALSDVPSNDVLRGDPEVYGSPERYRDASNRGVIALKSDAYGGLEEVTQSMAVDSQIQLVHRWQLRRHCVALIADGYQLSLEGNMCVDPNDLGITLPPPPPTEEERKMAVHGANWQAAEEAAKG